MKRIITATLTFGALAAAALGVAGTAAAAPVSHNSAAEAISQLEQMGYTVAVNVVNGPSSSLMSECSVSGVHGRAGTDSQGQPLAPAGTVYVDVHCPDDADS